MTPYFDQNGITIYHGDCRDILPELGKVDLLLTDPPYALGGSRKEWKATAGVANGLYLAARTVKKGGAGLVFTTTSARGFGFTVDAIHPVLAFNRILFWNKTFVNSQVAGPWRWDCVSIVGFGRTSFGRPQFSSMFQSKGPASPRFRGEGKHPAELPDGLSDWLYTPFDAPEIVTLDPFMGTGQLLVTPASLGRRVIGIEIEERYCEMAVRRLTEPKASIGEQMLLEVVA